MISSPSCALGLVGFFVSLAPTAFTSQQPALQADWFQSPINGHWYGVDYTPRTWTNSEALAVSLGGHLATVRSQVEQDWIALQFVDYLLDHGIWIGLEDQDADGQWEWTSGEPWTYGTSLGNNPWGAGEPNNPGTEPFLLLAGPMVTPAGSDDFAWHDAPASYGPVNLVRGLIELPTKPQVGWSWPRETATGSTPYYTTLGDMDGDGDLDVIVPAHGSGGQVEIYWNDGAGVLDPVPAVISTPSPYVPMPIDRDQDGDLDLLVTAGNKSVGCREWVNDGAGGFSIGGTLEGVQSHGIDIGDIDLDGFEDAVWSMNNIWQGLRPVSSIPADGFTQHPWFGTHSSTLFVRIVDLNADGAPDLVSSSVDSDTIRTWIGDGAGGFALNADHPTGADPFQIELADLDNDGDQDIIVAVGGANSIRLYENNGSSAGIDLIHQGDFPMGAYPRDVKIHDFNGDGFFDMAAACDNSNDLRIRYGVGPFDFSGPEVIFQNHTQANDLATGDLNGDGLIDLVTTSYGAIKITIHLNHFENQTDCNLNGIQDSLDIAAGTALDCNANGQIDSCEINTDPTLDLDLNGLIDSCESSTPLWVLSPINQQWYTVLPPLSWDDANVQAQAMGGHLATIIDQAENDWLAAMFPATVVMSDGLAWIGLNDLDTEGTFTWTSGSPVSFENWSPGEPDNFPIDQDFVAINTDSGLWFTMPDGFPRRGIVQLDAADCDSDAIPDAFEIAQAPELDWNGDGVLDTCAPPIYCDPALNSSGDGALIWPHGSPVISLNDFELTGHFLPPLQFGYFLMSASEDNVPGFGGGQGILCLGAPIRRLIRPGQILFSNNAGEVSLHVDLPNGLPYPVVLQPGATWNFQLWYRDLIGGQPTSNSSDGLTVMFR